VVPHVVIEAVCTGGAAEGVDFEERVGDRSCTIRVSRVGVHLKPLNTTRRRACEGFEHVRLPELMLPIPRTKEKIESVKAGATGSSSIKISIDAT
jgi:hypothetical protein